ncbi:MAG: type I-E CRISPR-associated protein Cas7/Cse4/CasC [Salinivirgaceae bacterium]|jgi:CRISPR system Cascade subunit CasC|nr:type I-E CRISPR-associated protein Cas7/Cse4/CasC [Salinivirgaceae bacterium]
MFIQIHMLQSMPPGNLNRDETGQPKKCIFGGVTRGRISSQCLKRNIRRSQQFKEAFGDALGERTTYLPQMVADELAKDGMLDVSKEELDQLMAAIAGRFKKEKSRKESEETEEENTPAVDTSESAGDEVGQTGQLVFFPPPFARRVAELLAQFRKEKPAAYHLFVTGEINETAEQRATRKAKGKELKERKKAISVEKKGATTDDEKAAIKEKEDALMKDEQQYKEDSQNAVKALKKEIDSLFANIAKASKSLTVDIGLFGRMTTSDLVVNVEATCQVAHAISTHETVIESDYFTAMDDCKAEYAASQMDKAGAAFLGSGETETFYSASVYYKYLNLDLDALRKHLSQNKKGWPDSEASKTVGILLMAAALANPTGKQNSFASHGIPELILVELSNVKRPISYANAFLEPVEGPNYLARSADALKTYVEAVTPAFAPADIDRYLLAVGHAKTEIGGAVRVETLDKLAETVGRASITPRVGATP